MEEMSALEKNNTWEMVDLFYKELVGCKWYILSSIELMVQ
jgi:hypothetical protein